jgi:hypothetical protein
MTNTVADRYPHRYATAALGELADVLNSHYRVADPRHAVPLAYRGHLHSDPPVIPVLSVSRGQSLSDVIVVVAYEIDDDGVPLGFLVEAYTSPAYFARGDAFVSRLVPTVAGAVSLIDHYVPAVPTH